MFMLSQFVLFTFIDNTEKAPEFLKQTSMYMNYLVLFALLSAVASMSILLLIRCTDG